MKKRKPPKRQQQRTKSRLIHLLLALVFGFSLHSCADIPAKGVVAAGNGIEQFASELNVALREVGTPHTTSKVSPSTHTDNDADSFPACRQFFARGRPPVVAPRPTNRALCYDAFAILHSGESKTAVFVAEKLNRASIADADEKRTNKFFSDARLRSAERATLDDYKGSGFDRGHMAPAGDMPTPQAMAQSFSLANMVPQASEHNRGVWARSVEAATRKYAERATGNVYVITGPVYEPSIASSQGIGAGQVRVPKYLFKLVYDEDKNRAWAHWHLNNDATRGSKPISYAELVQRTGINFLPGVGPEH
ncbi:DNA/RNA non-specific endonuclease [Polaromonas sp. CG_9.11]|uniref:DNA/RNA non-specific endonuclease n=1 Tax=Polaromonas sp. CG_9.11 TaxID=2787730 RepID=UPI0018CA55C6|nr:DNA/RNA non-specific endonuclease [Polaromonas sp. CG_9.11]MBG6078245.1 endonuclease G [Polaromonas sp. CG_9.11]